MSKCGKHVGVRGATPTPRGRTFLEVKRFDGVLFSETLHRVAKKRDVETVPSEKTFPRYINSATVETFYTLSETFRRRARNRPQGGGAARNSHGSPGSGWKRFHVARNGLPWKRFACVRDVETFGKCSPVETSSKLHPTVSTSRSPPKTFHRRDAGRERDVGTPGGLL